MLTKVKRDKQVESCGNITEGIDNLYQEVKSLRHYHEIIQSGFKTICEDEKMCQSHDVEFLGRKLKLQNRLMWLGRTKKLGYKITRWSGPNLYCRPQLIKVARRDFYNSVMTFT